MSAQYSDDKTASNGVEGGTPPSNIALYQLNTPIKQQQQTELKVRKRLASGIPQDAPSCDYHRGILAGLLQHHKGDSMDYVIPSSDPLFTFAKRFEQTITSHTALLPFCFTCTKRELSLQPDQPIPKVDGCVCATSIALSECCFCEVARLEAAKNSAIAQRRWQVPNTTRYILKCACGHVGGKEEARRCAACLGIVAMPFKNMAGLVVVHHPHTPWVRGWWNPQGQPQPQNALPFLKTDGKVRQRPEASSGTTVVTDDSAEFNVEGIPMQQWSQGVGNALFANPSAGAQSSQGNAGHGPSTPANIPIPLELPSRTLPYRPGINLGDSASVFNEANGWGTLGDDEEGEAPDFSASDMKIQPMFVHEEIRKIQDLSLGCDPFSYELGRPPSGPERAQFVLKKNASTFMSFSTSVELFKVCGLDHDELAKVMKEVGKMGNVTGEDVAIAMWVALEGLVE